MSVFKDIGKVLKHPEKIIKKGSNPVSIITDIAGDQIDITKLVAKEVAKQLPDQIKDLPHEVMQEAVGHILIPLVHEIISPIQKVAFHEAASAIRSIVQQGDKLLANPYHVPPELISQAKKYYNPANLDQAIHWGNWLIGVGQLDWVKKNGGAAAADFPEDVLKPMTVDEALAQERIWGGWKPFRKALELYYPTDSLKADLDSMSIYTDVKSNVTIGFYFNKPYTRGHALADKLDKWARRGVPTKRSGVREFITDLGPDKLDVTASVNFQLGFIAGGSGGLWGIPTRIGLQFLDIILTEIGVPA